MRRPAPVLCAGLRSAGFALAFLTLALSGACDAGPTTGTGPLYAHEDPRFQVAVLRPQAGDGLLRAEVTPRPPWKLAERFPCRLELREPEARIEPVAFSAEAAAFELSRRDRERLEGSLAFAVCHGDLCIPVDHPFEARLP